MITINEEIVVPYAPERVWQILSDPVTVASCIAGAELTGTNEDGSLDGVLTVKFGAVRVAFKGTVTLELNEPARSGKIGGTGKDGQGATRFNANADFAIIEDETSGSRVTLQGTVELAGKLASVVESGASAVIARMKQDFATRLIERCGEVAGAEQTGPAPVPAMEVHFTDVIKSWWRRFIGIFGRRSSSDAPTARTSKRK